MNRQLRARLLLEEARALGIDLDDLVAIATGVAKPITVAAWIDEIASTFGPSTAATYRPYWRLAAGLLGDRYLAELTTAVRATSTDPDRDLLLIRFHLETGARRQGALSLRIRDIDTGRATLWLREKNDTEREQPASPSLVALVLAHAADRGGSDAGDRVFRSRQGEPITGRRYDRLFARARESLDWDGRIPVSAHVLRHTAITRIGRIAGYPVAQAFAGHAPPSVTGRYLHASVADVATAVAALTGEDHPLAHPGRDSLRRSCADPRR